MSEASRGNFLKENWWLLLVLAAAVAGTGYFVVFSGGGEDDMAQVTTETTGGVAVGPTRTYADRDKTEEEARVQIQEYEEQVEEDPGHEDTASRLQAAGNLYMTKLQDYEAAALKYQQLLTEFPDFEYRTTIYPNLEVCFKQMEDNAGLTWLFEKMIELEPPDSNEAEYAKVQLGLISMEEAKEMRKEREARDPIPDGVVPAAPVEEEEAAPEDEGVTVTTETTENPSE